MPDNRKLRRHVLRGRRRRRDGIRAAKRNLAAWFGWFFSGKMGMKKDAPR